MEAHELREAIGLVTEAASKATAAAEKSTVAAEAAATAASSAATAANAATAAANASTAAVHDLSKSVTMMRRDFGVLWRKVHGSDPPPPDGAQAPEEIAGQPPLDELVSAADERARLAAAHASSLSSSLAALEVRVMSELRRQSTVLGVENQNVSSLAKRAGTRSLVRVFTAGAACIAALAGVVAAFRAPVAPLPQLQPIPYVMPAPMPAQPIPTALVAPTSTIAPKGTP